MIHPTRPLKLNERAMQLCRDLIERSDEMRVVVHDDGTAAPLVDCGVAAPGSLAAGIAVSEICMSGLGNVSLLPASPGASFARVCCQTDDPVPACLASQYAGWQISADDYFAMASGPMRCAAGKEELFASIGYTEAPNLAVGVLESGELPPASVTAQVAKEAGVPNRRLTLLVARTASFVGTMQIVARSVETAMHKLNELGFDVSCVRSGLGSAPLPPVGGDDMTAMGRTNDAILYGGEVTLWCDAEDASLEKIAPQVPSCHSPDYGRPFAELFAACDHDFYKIDKQLFSPARITLVNLNSGKSFRAGSINMDTVERSFEA